MGVSGTNLWAVAGIVYALAGVALFCNAVYLNPAPSRATAGNSAFVADTRTLRRMFEQWLDARVGAALLFVGFFLQATGALGTAALNKPAVFVLLGLALAAAYYAFMKDLIVDQMVDAQDAALPDSVTPIMPKKLAPPVILVADAQVEKIGGPSSTL